MTWTIEILSVGKTKEIWLKTAIQEYEKRMKGTFKFIFTLTSSSDSLDRLVRKRRNLIFLDPKGNSYTSELFSEFLFEKLSKSRDPLCFVIGGAEGIPQSLLKLGETLSLSQMTLTHQMTRLFLIEQVYRAVEIEKGSPYHK